LSVCPVQGDQIGRIFSIGRLFLSGHFWENYVQKKPTFLVYFFSVRIIHWFHPRNWFVLLLGRIFRQLIRSPWSSYLANQTFPCDGGNKKKCVHKLLADVCVRASTNGMCAHICMYIGGIRHRQRRNEHKMKLVFAQKSGLIVKTLSTKVSLLSKV
jgi:hypothetical protein